MKIVAIVGSIGKDSVNRKLAEFLKGKYKSDLDIEILTLEEFPMFSVDIETNPPKAILEARNSIKSADGVLFITPEYNYSIPGVLKNALDWLSRGEFVLKDKPAMILGATPGRFGTVRAQLQLRQILQTPNLGVLLLPGSEICIGGINDLMNPEGQIIDDGTIKFLDRNIKEFTEWVEQNK